MSAALLAAAIGLVIVASPGARSTYVPPSGQVTVGGKTQTFKGGACFKRQTKYKFDASIGGGARLLQIQVRDGRGGRFLLPSDRAKVFWRIRGGAFYIDPGSMTVSNNLMSGSFSGRVFGRQGVVGRGRGSWRCFSLVPG